MATIPTPSTAVASTTATSTSFNNHRDSLEYLLGVTMTGGGGRRPVAHLRQIAAQAITTSSWTVVTFGAEDVDYDGGHSTSSNTDRYTAATAGWYFVHAIGAFAANATGDRAVRFTVNGSPVIGTKARVGAIATFETCVPTGGFVYLAVNDILRVEVWQSSGGSLNTDGAASSMSVDWRST